MTKLDANGAGVVYSTFLGGSESDGGFRIAVDSSGCAYVTGYSEFDRLPDHAGVLRRHLRRRNLRCLRDEAGPGRGALLYSTYLGGGQGDSQYAGYDLASEIAVDNAGNAFVTGFTYSSDFPITPGAFDTTFSGGDVFVTKLLANGSALAYSTYLGGSANDVGNGIAVDSAGRAYVTGVTASSDFPTTPGAFDVTRGGGIFDAFVTKLEASGAALVYSTYLGGSEDEFGAGNRHRRHGQRVRDGGNRFERLPDHGRRCRRHLRRRLSRWLRDEAGGERRGARLLYVSRRL